MKKFKLTWDERVCDDMGDTLYFEGKSQIIEASKQIVKMGCGFCSLEDDLSFHTEQLKEIVEAYELVKSYQFTDDIDDDPTGLDGVNAWLESYGLYADAEKFNRVKKAIALVEEIEANKLGVL